MVKRLLKSAVKHNGVLYRKGAELDLDGVAEVQLDALGVLEPAAAASPAEVAVGPKRKRGKAAELDLDAEASAQEVQFGAGRSELEPGDL